MYITNKQKVINFVSSSTTKRYRVKNIVLKFMSTFLQTSFFSVCYTKIRAQ